MEEPKNWGPQWFLKSISSIQSYGPLFSFKVRFLWDMQILQRWSKNVVLSYADNAILEQLDKSLLSHRVTKWAMVTVVDDRNFWIEPFKKIFFSDFFLIPVQVLRIYLNCIEASSVGFSTTAPTKIAYRKEKQIQNFSWLCYPSSWSILTSLKNWGVEIMGVHGPVVSLLLVNNRKHQKLGVGIQSRVQHDWWTEGSFSSRFSRPLRDLHKMRRGDEHKLNLLSKMRAKYCGLFSCLFMHAMR